MSHLGLAPQIEHGIEHGGLGFVYAGIARLGGYCFLSHRVRNAETPSLPVAENHRMDIPASRGIRISFAGDSPWTIQPSPALPRDLRPFPARVPALERVRVRNDGLVLLPLRLTVTLPPSFGPLYGQAGIAVRVRQDNPGRALIAPVRFFALCALALGCSRHPVTKGESARTFRLPGSARCAFSPP